MDEEIEVMHVLRLPPLGQLVVAVGDQRYESLSEVTGDEVKHRLIAAIGELIAFAGGYDTLVNAGVAPPAATLETTESEGTSLEERQAAFISSLEEQRDETRATSEAPEPPRFSLLPRPRPPAAAPKPPTEPQMNIVEQIDAILQKHVAAEPRLEGRSIHLEQAPAGGLRIVVDDTYYQRPSEIEEKEIKLVIKMALTEWEAN